MENLKIRKRVLGFVVLVWTMLTAGCVMAAPEEIYSIEYYQSFVGYDLPLRLTNRTTKQEAEAKADAAYYVAYFDSDKKILRVEKMFRGVVLFQHKYFYHPNGKLRRTEEKDEGGTLIVREYDESGKPKR